MAKKPANKISVLIPSRNRTIQLANGVRQILAMAADPSRVEILLRLDCDDEASLQAFRRLRRAVPAVAVVDDRYAGWASNHVFYNALARQATGDWLLLYNDDAQMLTALRQLDLDLPTLYLEVAADPRAAAVIEEAWNRELATALTSKAKS
jgi:glycosyltransferase involved in cell wall biosynthesis